MGQGTTPGRETAKRIVIIDDHPIVVRGVADILAQSDEFVVVATALNLQEAIEAVRNSQPDLAILDLRLGQELAPDVIPRLLEVAPDLKLAILTAYDDGALLASCLAQGASAVILKDASGLDLVSTLRRVFAGERVVDPRLASPAHRRSENGRYGEGGFERLSAREHEILRLLARGLNTREMASELSLMPNTVRSYTQAVLGKLQSKNRIMALATARRLRLI
jgi:DNA-binding NarL/FixJ family response regulator